MVPFLSCVPSMSQSLHKVISKMSFKDDYADFSRSVKSIDNYYSCHVANKRTIVQKDLFHFLSCEPSMSQS